MVIYFKKSMWRWPDLNDAQSQISDTVLCPPSIQTTFVWNIFSALLKKYFGATFKMGHPV